MKLIHVYAAFAIVVAGDSELQHRSSNSLVNDPEWITWLNYVNTANSTWIAGPNAFFDRMTFDSARSLLGTNLLPISDYLHECLDDSVYAAIDGNIPASFDARDRWHGLIHPIRDQQSCGSCWAFSASEVLSDRKAIATGKVSEVLSPEDLVSCDPLDLGCQGGSLPNAWDYLKKSGIVTDKCLPYTAGNGTAPGCPSTCADSENWNASKVKAKTAYAINGVVNMQKEIMTNGPIQVAFNVYPSFLAYKSGVYQKHWYELLTLGGHSVKMLGWGTENGTDYWLVANSWNTTWGIDGFFKILRGVDHCDIEGIGPPYAGMPVTDTIFMV